MKAITCPQCGATIENVSERSVIIDCEYCGARIMMDARKAEVKPPLSNDPPPDFELAEPPTNPFVKVIGIGLALAILPVVIAIFAVRADKPLPARISSAPAPPITYQTPSWSTPDLPPEKAPPVVNYQPRVSWEGPNDMEYFDEPQVDVSSVSDLTSEEVVKTVFKNRVVKLRVVINTEGEIDTVETISGHPLLVDAATASAKSSIFRSRSKPTTRVLTYTFRVLKD